MNTTVSTDVKSLNDVVRDKVKETFVNMIPDEQWNAMVQKCVDSFVEQDLPVLVKEILSEKLKNETAEKIASELTYSGSDRYGRPTPSKLIETIVKTMTADVVNELIGSIMMGAVQRVQQQMRNY